jgi:hypothetical protein
MNNLQEFIYKYREQSFPHSEALFSALDKGKAKLHYEESDQIPCDAVLRIYRRRAEHLKTLGPEDKELLEDVTALCEQLDKAPGEMIQGWTFEMAAHFLFYVFEGVNSKRIPGCSFGVDKRLVDNNDASQSVEPERAKPVL